MVNKCCIPNCRGNYTNTPTMPVFSFPRDPHLQQKWISLIQRENFQPTKYSRVCELHFEPSQILREASAYDSKTGRTLTAPLRVPRLKKDAVPTLFMPPAGTLFKSKMHPDRRRKKQPKEKKVEEEEAAAEMGDGSELPTIPTDFRNGSRNAIDSMLVKQEIVYSEDESPPQPDIGRVPQREVRDAQEWSAYFAGSSSSSSSSSSSCPSDSSDSSDSSHALLTNRLLAFSNQLTFPENASSIANTDSSKVGGTSETDVSNKPAQTRKTNDAKPDADDATPNVTQVKLCRLAKPSMPSTRNSKAHPFAGTSKETAVQRNLIDSGNESQNVAATSIVVKQEPVESVDEPPRLVIEKKLFKKEMVSPSSIGASSSSSSCTISAPGSSNQPPFPKNASPIASPDSTNVDGTSATRATKKPAQKRKTNYADEATSNAIQARCRRAKRPMPSKENSKSHPVAGTSSGGRSTVRTNSGENATREMFRFLVDGSENNPLFGCRNSGRPGDLFNVFSDFIADKLREMDWDDCAYALRTILDVVFKAGQVRHDSESETDSDT